jgi:hypothetical protein
MGRPARGSSAPRTRKPKLLARLTAEEAAEVLRILLQRHPKLEAEAEEIARVTVTEIDAEDIAADVEYAVLALDYDDLNPRAGRHSWGYVEPNEAAWELLEEALEPFLDEMKRHIELGFEPAARATCAGILLGLYRCRGKDDADVLRWAPDFLRETAGRAVEMLGEESAARHRRAWRLADAVLDEVPEWAEMIRRVSKPTGQRR